MAETKKKGSTTKSGASSTKSKSAGAKGTGAKASGAKSSSKSSTSSAKKSGRVTDISKTGTKRTKEVDKEMEKSISNEQLALEFERHRRYVNEIIIISTVVVSLLLFLSNFQMTGAFGAAINSAVFGLFGWLAYIMPIIFIGIAVGYTISSTKNNQKIFWYKLIPAVIICMLFAGMIQLAVGDAAKDTKLFDYYHYSRDFKTGGGFFGGILCALFVPAFGRIGTFIVLAALEIICLMFLTGKAFMQTIGQFIHDDGKKAIERHREAKEAAKEIRQAKQEEMEEQMVHGNEPEKRVNLIKEYSKVASDSYGDEYGHSDLMNTEKRQKVISFLLGETSYETEEKKPNFFGGTTPTKVFDGEGDTDYSATNVEQKPNDYIAAEGSNEAQTIGRLYDKDSEVREIDANLSQGGLSKEDQKLIYNGEYYASSEVVDAVNTIYENELAKKFGYSEDNSGSGEASYSAATAGVVRATSGLARPIEKKEVKLGSQSHKYEILTDEEKQEIDAETLKEYGGESYSETALRDRQNGLSGKVEKTVFDQKPYGGVGPIKRVSENEADNSSVSAEPQDAKVRKPRTVKTATSGKAVNPEEKILDVEDSETTAVDISQEPSYKYPDVSLLKDGPAPKNSASYFDELESTAQKLQETLDSFGVKVKVTNKTRGPAVTRYELTPEQGVKVSRITNLADDIKLNLAAADIRIEAPIPGKPAVGIEVPNLENTMVSLKELIVSQEFDKDNRDKSNLSFTVGKDIAGNIIIGDIAKMPHLLIAGSTGSGKSVCINTIIMSLLYRAHPDDVKLIMIDPKVVELSVYNGIPHLLIPVVTDPKKAAQALNWAVQEMEERYNKFAQLSVRDLKGYNARVREEEAAGNVDEKYPIMPQIVVIVDEMADLMMVASNEVEDAICRLAQKSRACGIHLILATQRPSVNVITGLIKANVPSRIAFAVSSGVDSRTILDTVGAEKLLGKGDMLYAPSGLPKPIRVQGAFVSDGEVNAVVDFLKSHNDVKYNDDVSNQIASTVIDSKTSTGPTVEKNDGRDANFAEAGRTIIQLQRASSSILQRKMKIGFNTAARVIEELEEAGVVGPQPTGNKSREILMTAEEFEEFLLKEE